MRKNKKKRSGNQTRKSYRGDPYKKLRFCDPGACHCCRDIGGGDFRCDEHNEIVVEDWKPTVAYMICKQKGGRSDGRR